jgi:hypothetical protein
MQLWGPLKPTIIAPCFTPDLAEIAAAAKWDSTVQQQTNTTTGTVS